MQLCISMCFICPLELEVVFPFYCNLKAFPVLLMSGQNFGGGQNKRNQF